MFLISRRDSRQFALFSNRLSAGLVAASRAVWSVTRLLIAGAVFVSLGMQPGIAAAASANSIDAPICHSDADYFLGIEDYTTQNERSASLRPDSSAAITSSENTGWRNLAEANESESMVSCVWPSLRDGNDSVVVIGATGGHAQPGTYADSSYSSQVLVIPVIGEGK